MHCAGPGRTRPFPNASHRATRSEIVCSGGHGADHGWCPAQAATAAFTVAWVAFAADKPAEVDDKPAAAAAGGAAAVPAVPAKPPAKAWDWRVLIQKPSLALLGFHLSFNFMDATRHQLSPMMYMEKFNCSPVQVGLLLQRPSNPTARQLCAIE